MEERVYNPLRTYTPEEVSELMHSSTDTVRTWIKTGILKCIKTGRGMVVTSAELLLFQEAAQGMEISNLKATLDSRDVIIQRKEAARGLV